MRVIIFGASGMVGQGVLRECLADERVREVRAVVRSPLGVSHPKLRVIEHADLADLGALDGELRELDACFFCLGVSSLGMKEAAYRRVTYDMTLAAARPLAAHNPALAFVYVSGEGTDATERGRVMWARVKGETENALLALGFRAYLFRPGFIQAGRGIVSRTRLYRALYVVARPLYPLLRRLVPGHVTTTRELGRAMLAVPGLAGTGPRVLGSREINALAARDS